MPPQQGYQLTREDMQRMGRAMRFFEKLTRENFNLTPGTGFPPTIVPPGQTIAWFCKCTAEPPGGAPDLSDLYEGTLYIPDEDDASNPPKWREEACWLRPLPDQEYLVGQTGTARIVGWRPEDVGFPGVAGTYAARPIYTFEAGDNPNESYSQEELNSHPAFTIYLTSEPGADPETSDTFVIQIGQVGDDGGPFYVIRYYPEGTNNDETYSYQLSHNASNQLVSETFVISMNGATYTLTRTPIGETYVIQIGTTSYTRTRTEDEETYAITINGVTETVETISEAAGAIVRAFGGTVDFTGATVTGLGTSGVAQWKLVATITHAALTDADTQQDILAVTLPAKTCLHDHLVRTKTVGSGGGVATLSFNILIGAFTQTTPSGDGLAANDIACQRSGVQYSPSNTTPIAWAATTDIFVRFESDVNLDTLTGGEWEVYVRTSTIP